jgi:hypothetical protein
VAVFVSRVLLCLIGKRAAHGGNAGAGQSGARNKTDFHFPGFSLD